MGDEQREPLVTINNADEANTNGQELVLTASHGHGRTQSSESSFKAGAAESGSHKNEGGDWNPGPKMRRSLLVFHAPFYLVGWRPHSDSAAQQERRKSERGESERGESEEGESSFSQRFPWCNPCNVLHAVVVLFIVVVLSVLQILMCMRKDTINIRRNITQCTDNEHEIYICRMCLDNLLEFIIPDLLIIVAYLISYWVFLNNPKSLEKLIQQVCDYSHDEDDPEKPVVHKIRIQMVIGYLWVVYASLVGIFRILARESATNNTPPVLVVPKVYRIALECFCTVLFIMFDLIYMSIIVNYSCHCQLFIDIIDKIKARIKDGTWPEREDNTPDRGKKIGKRIVDSDQLIDKAVEAIERVRTSICTELNHYTSWNVSMVMFIFVVSIFYAVSALVELNAVWVNNVQLIADDYWVLVSTFLNITQRLLILFYPLVQAARLSSACSSLRIVEYRTTDQKQRMDIFRNYLSSQRFRAKLVCLPMTPGPVAGALFIIACILIISLQTSFFSWTPTTL